jgi:hypothetical protein
MEAGIAGETMSNRFIALTSGWIPIFVLLMLAVALVSGQKRDDRSAGKYPAPPAAVDLLINLPEDVETSLEAVRQIIDVRHPLLDATQNQKGAL